MSKTLTLEALKRAKEILDRTLTRPDTIALAAGGIMDLAGILGRPVVNGEVIGGYTIVFIGVPVALVKNISIVRD